jgi:hypothetical protein
MHRKSGRIIWPIFISGIWSDIGNSAYFDTGIRPDNPTYFGIRYPAGYRISLPDTQ